MRRQLFGAVLLVSQGFIIGCADRHSAITVQRQPITNPALTTAAPPATRPVVPFIYAHWFDEVLPPVPPAEAARILREAGRFKPAGMSIWFVLVREDATDHKRQWFTAAEVYYTADVSTARLRVGRRARIYTSDVNFEPEIDRYVQVSPADHPFGRQLEVPEAKWLPIPEAERVPDEDLVSLVDAARAAQKMELATMGSRDEPVGRIHRDGDTYTVEFGWNVSIYSQFLQLEKSAGIFRVTGSGIGAL